MSEPLALIVDDHVDSATIFAEALNAAGCRTEIIRSGDKALARLATVTPDMVILDLGLPHVAGTEILHHIRADPRLARVRVVVITAHPQLAESARDEADMVLIKPVGFSQLRNAVARLGISASLEEE